MRIRPTEYVYFVRDEASGLIKIGACTGDPYARLSGGRNFNPNPLTMLGFFKVRRNIRPTIGRTHRHVVEHGLHVRFAADRQFREWFKPTPDLLSLIADLCPPVRGRRRLRSRRCGTCVARGLTNKQLCPACVAMRREMASSKQVAQSQRTKRAA